MVSLEVLKRKIDTAKDLKSVVRTMKALAAVSIRQYEKSVLSLSDYDRTMKMGIQVLLKNYPEVLIDTSPLPSPRYGIVVFGSDQGMCGQFNEKIGELALENIAKINPSYFLIATVGSRVRDRLEAARQDVKICLNVPSSIAGITPVVQEMVLILEGWRSNNQINQIIVLHNSPRGNSSYNPQKNQIFPLNPPWLKELQKQPWGSRVLPTFTMEKETLASALFRQHFFVSLYKSCAESLASENAGRLVSMQIAEKNIAECLEALQAEFNQLRQAIITEELLDIVSGFEALTQ
jgi:F-type H+-transporting ATPase subunit gamma